MSKSLYERHSFEVKNNLEEKIPSGLRHAFHVSSEGELSQIYPLLEKVILEQQALLIFTSPSLENRVESLKCQLGPNLFVRRVSFTDKPQLLTLKNQLETLSLCRYDFLPELMLLGLGLEKFYILNATSVKWRNKWNIRSIFSRTFYKQFQLVTTSNNKDFLAFSDIYEGPVININLRVLEVRQRQMSFAQFNEASLLSLSKQKVVGVGSAWRPEVEVLVCPEIKKLLVNKKICILIFPHSFNPDHLKEIHLTLKQNNMIFNQANKLEDIFKIKNGDVYIVNVKGILCELYPYFDVAIVGGGFGKGVHSVLEPMVSGTPTICGYQVHRSTEVDQFKSEYPAAINVTNTLDKARKVLLKVLENDSGPNMNISAEENHNLTELLEFYEPK